MKNIKAKKALGQHFLNDRKTAQSIVGFLQRKDAENIVEIGPGMGVLSQFLKDIYPGCRFIELDAEAVSYLENRFPEMAGKIIHRDFLKVDLNTIFHGKMAIIGNFPYNISSQILFKVLENRDKVVEIVGMFQKEVADRIISPPGSKVYGILSVYIQAYYDTESLMVLGPEMFDPPPKVKSAVIRLSRNAVQHLDCDETLFFRLVKQTFNQRRKMIRNSLKLLGVGTDFNSIYLTMRPEQLGVGQFSDLTRQLTLYFNRQKNE